MLLALTAGEYAVLIPLVITSIAGAVVSIITALRTTEIRRQVTPPSEPQGGRTLGEITEGVMVNAHAAAADAARARHAVASPATGLAAIHGAVVTANGKTLGALADLAEGRRVDTDVAHGDRSVAEQHYVDRSDADAAQQAAAAAAEPPPDPTGGAGPPPLRPVD